MLDMNPVSLLETAVQYIIAMNYIILYYDGFISQRLSRPTLHSVKPVFLLTMGSNPRTPSIVVDVCVNL